jgi:hypothetical protein
MLRPFGTTVGIFVRRQANSRQRRKFCATAALPCGNRVSRIVFIKRSVYSNSILNSAVRGIISWQARRRTTRRQEDEGDIIIIHAKYTPPPLNTTIEEVNYGCIVIMNIVWNKYSVRGDCCFGFVLCSSQKISRYTLKVLVTALSS